MLLRASVVQCSQGGKGFGSSTGKESLNASKGTSKRKPEVAGVKSADSKAVQRAVELVEKEEARERGRGGPPAARPVDPREAARGKVEYVKVKDWGSGAPEDLGSLQLNSEAKQVFAAGSGDCGGDGGGEGEGDAPAAMPFHEALARRLEMLQTQGALGVAQLKGAKPLPPFERWAFSRQHYTEYLADMYAVHAALETSVAAATACMSAELAAAAGGAGAGEGSRREQLLAALRLFGFEQGLDRAAQLLLDLERLQEAGQQQEQQQSQEQEQGQQRQQAEASSGGGSSVSGAGQAGSKLAVPAPTQHAAAYAAYIASLGRLVRAAEGPAEEEQAVLRLLAHAYIVHLMHLTSGGRIAAAAAEKLQLAASDALHFYKSHPLLEKSEARPLEVFVANTNALGQLLSEGQREGLMQELAKAMTKTSMLLVPLAREA